MIKNGEENQPVVVVVETGESLNIQGTACKFLFLPSIRLINGNSQKIESYWLHQVNLAVSRLQSNWYNSTKHFSSRDLYPLPSRSKENHDLCDRPIIDPYIRFSVTCEGH